jgi:methylated-DNA-[protein]-cysteine S-methyltransferase
VSAPVASPRVCRAPRAGAGSPLYTHVTSPLGRLLLTGDEDRLWSISMERQRGRPGVGPEWREAAEPFFEVRLQLEQYFSGERTEFELPLRITGSDFQRRVWRALRSVPYGKTCSYGELAASIGSPRAARATGLANGRNPFAIVIPCHRVVGAQGALVGYGGGLGRKRWLLEHERRERARRS